MPNPQHYARFLNRELQRRRSLDPCYSLRSFARELKLSPSFLSDVLTGRRGLSPGKAGAIAQILEFTPAATNEFQLMTQWSGLSPFEKESFVLNQQDEPTYAQEGEFASHAVRVHEALADECVRRILSNRRSERKSADMSSQDSRVQVPQAVRPKCPPV